MRFEAEFIVPLFSSRLAKQAGFTTNNGESGVIIGTQISCYIPQAASGPKLEPRFLLSGNQEVQISRSLEASSECLDTV